MHETPEISFLYIEPTVQVKLSGMEKEGRLQMGLRLIAIDLAISFCHCALVSVFLPTPTSEPDFAGPAH